MKFNLTVEEVNLVLAGLGNMPYVQVFELVTKIRTTAQEQLENNKKENHD